MTNAELIGSIIYGGIAALLAIGLIVAMLVASSALRAGGQWLGPLLLIMLMLGGAVSIGLSSRNLTLANLMAQTLGAGDVETLGIGRWLNRSIVAIVAAGALGALLNRIYAKSDADDAGGRLLLAFASMSLLGNYLPSIFGTEPVFYHNQLYPLLAVTWVCLVPRSSMAYAVRIAKFCIALLLLASFVLAFVKPELVLQSNYKGWVPGMHMRLWGLASHANLIAPVALTLFALEYAYPSPGRIRRYLFHSFAMTALVLSQSKTNWIVALMLWGLLGYVRSLQSGAYEGRAIIMSARKLVMLLAPMAACLGILVAALMFDFGAFLDKFQRSDIALSIQSGSGRSGIWALAIEEFVRNPGFGYGPSIWEPQYRVDHNMLYAFHAHNLLMQSLSMSGALGLLGMTAYLAVLAVFSIRGMRASNGLSLAMLAMLLIRAVSEVPLPNKALFSLDLWLHLLMLTVLRLSQPPFKAVKVLQRVPPGVAAVQADAGAGNRGP